MHTFPVESDWVRFRSFIYINRKLSNFSRRQEMRSPRFGSDQDLDGRLPDSGLFSLRSARTDVHA